MADESKERDLLDILMQAQKPLSSSELAFRMHLSEKTVLKYLNLLKAGLIDSGASIEIKQGSGSYLAIHDQTRFSQFLSSGPEEDYISNPQLRKKYILLRLMTEGDYVNVYDLADELFISPSLLRSIIKSCPEILDEYNLTLEHSYNHGYMIVGAENDIRRCIKKECANEDMSALLVNTDLNYSNIDTIRKIVSEALKYYHIAISNEGIDSLSLHILIAINRIETNNPIKLADETMKGYVRSSSEYFVTGIINKNLEKAMNIKLPESELIYLAVHISGKQRFFGHEKLQVKVSQDALVFYNKFLRNIYQLANEDFFEDDELRITLLNHIVPFLNRANHNLQIVKTDLNDVKQQFPYAYELTLYGMTVLEEQGIAVTSAEISYFALHLALSLEKRNTNVEKINTAVICNELSGLFDMLSYKLRKYFGENIGMIQFMTPQEAGQFSFDHFPLVLSTTSLSIVIPREVIQISAVMTDQDISAVRARIKHLMTCEELNDIMAPSLFMLIHATSKDDALDQMLRAISTVYTLPKDFRERINARERLESTEYENRIAIPHPLETTDCPNFVAVAQLTKPIIWNEKPVQLIFLSCIATSSKTTSHIFKIIGKIASDSDLAQKLISERNFDGFMQIFNSIDV